MKLHELELSKELNAYGDNLTAIIKKYGWTFLGKGVDATVAEHPDKKYVIKIFKPISGYRTFVKFVEENQDNPHVPKISSTIRKIPGVTRYDYIRMEKLKQLRAGMLYENFLPEMICLYAAFHRTGNILIDLRFKLINAFDDSEVIVNDFESPNKLAKIYKKYREPSSTWITFSKSFAEFTAANISNINKVLDLHQGNFMLRGNTLVMIDPYINRGAAK